MMFVPRYVVPVLFAVGLLASCAQAPAPDADPLACGTFGSYTDAFPTPVESATSPFASIDDDVLEVAFGSGFSFPFYGTEYASVFVNTNGGVTFGAGLDDYDLAATDIVIPAIAVFWGDMDAGNHPDRSNQMRWRQSDGCFQIAYDDFADNDDQTWSNSATLTLVDDGRIQIAYGDVMSEDILIGVFDGTHADDTTPAVQAEYDLFANGTGIVLFDDWGAGTTYDGSLDGTTVLFRP